MRKTARNTLLLVLLAFAATASHAQIKCWNDENGKRVCGDTPPAGAKVKTIKAPNAPSAPAASSRDPASKDAKDAKKGPLTPAEQEQEYRKRQAEAQKASAKADEERKAADAKRENCDRAREMVATLESGQRIPRMDSKGERYYLNEAQVAQETAKARDVAKQNCN